MQLFLSLSAVAYEEPRRVMPYYLQRTQSFFVPSRYLNPLWVQTQGRASKSAWSGWVVQYCELKPLLGQWQAEWGDWCMGKAGGVEE